MTFSAAITTFSGAFIFPFLIRLLWGKLANDYGGLGGWLAAGFIVGTSWALNHGVGMIVQTGAWVDMAWAAGAGLFFASAISKDHFGKGLINAGYAALGGVIGGFILSHLG